MIRARFKDLPQFAAVDTEVHIGKPWPHCAGCKKPFNLVRKWRMEIRMTLQNCPVPFAFAYKLCGGCAAKVRKGGEGEAAVLAAVEAFHQGAPLQ